MFGVKFTKKKILKFIILLFIATIVLTGCGRGDINIEKKQIVFSELSELIDNENLNDITLTIYYLSPFILTRTPLSAEDLINHSDVNKIVVSGNYLELLIQINNAKVVSAEQESYLNARLYYVFETKNGEKIFDVAMWGDNGSSIFANGIEVEENDVFYNVIMQFLPENEAKEMQDYINDSHF